jgi:osomolarity two-component system sensor histidine kinase SLN1
MKMRIAIREQLAAAVILAVGVALTVVSIPTWVFVNDFVKGVSGDALTLTASLKAARVSSELNLIQTACQTISTRLMLQDALIQFYDSQVNNITDTDSWAEAQDDLESALGSSGFSGLLQARLYSRNTTGGKPNGLLSINGIGANESGPILLPYRAPDGSPVHLGDFDYGFPPSLFPNITYRDLGRPNQAMANTNAFSAEVFPGVSLGNGSERTGVMLGPLVVNSTFALISLTIPVREVTNGGFILGYMTLVANTKTLVEAQKSNEGLGKTGIVLLIGSTNPWNHFSAPVAASNESWMPPLGRLREQNVQFLLPPPVIDGHPDRHSQRSFRSGKYNDPFILHQYSAALNVLRDQNTHPNNATNMLSTKNEQGYTVAVGVARPQTPLASWAIVVEQDESEAYEPIHTLRTILLGCVFGTLGLVLLIVFPFAHWSVLPIRRLTEATKNSYDPPGYEDDDEDDVSDEENPSSGGTTSGRSSEKGMLAKLRRKMRKRRRARLRRVLAIEPGRNKFKIPAKVEDGKHFVTDELTELTQTFNEMTDELFKQYSSLDEKVAERTRELEVSKKAAEAANESKTLFIANISHELKTPLNGIMGMCAVCMEEDDLQRIKQSLKTVYKSGDLLLHLLEDLLSFSKNQIGQQVALEEREFRLGDVRSQIVAIFDKQVRESKVGFTVKFVSDTADALSGSERRASMDRRLPALGPPGVGRLKDMCLWGDQHRILQVIINLVSNSLKFTPAGGKVHLRIRCLGEVEQPGDESRTSSFSKTGSNRAGRTRHRMGSGSTNSASSKGAHTPILTAKGGTALAINPVDPKESKAVATYIQIRERSPTPPPPNARTFLFEFEVEDTGPGIPEHLQQMIFEPFMQGDLGLSKKYGGTGLGLSICSQLATLMGGTISVRSTPGTGTTFTMQIPLKYVKDR